MHRFVYACIYTHIHMCTCVFIYVCVHVCVCVCVCASVAQSSLTLWDPMDLIQPGSSVHGIL